jgi:hypothetical protein
MTAPLTRLAVDPVNWLLTVKVFVTKKSKKVLNRILLAVAALALFVGLTDPQWQVKLNCAAVVLIAAAIELGFAAKAECRVFRPGMRRPCSRTTWGILLGCHDHRPTKLLAWIGYLGAESVMRRLGMPRAYVATSNEAALPATVPGGPAPIAVQTAPSETRLNNPGRREDVEFKCLLISTVASVASVVIAVIAL